MINRHILRYTLTFCLILIVLMSGCENITKPDASPTSDVQATAVIEDVVTEVSFGFIDISEPSADNGSVSKIIQEMLLKDFNIDLKPITLTKENWKDELSWMISVNQLPDVFYHDITLDKVQFRQMLDLGQIQPIPKNLWVEYEHLSMVLSWYEGIYSIDGEMYFIDRKSVV